MASAPCQRVGLRGARDGADGLSAPGKLLAGEHVASALEYLAAIGSAEAPSRKPLSREAWDLWFARCCYDHLAGLLGVRFMDSLCAKGWLRR